MAFILGADPDQREGDEGFEDEIDDDEDETLSERLWGLTEMFPEPVRKATGWTTTTAWGVAKGAFSLGRQALWVVSATAAVMIAPCMIEKISAIMAEAELNQQKQLMFGPGGSKLPSSTQGGFYNPQSSLG